MIPRDRLLEMARECGFNAPCYLYGEDNPATRTLTKFAAMIENEVLARAVGQVRMKMGFYKGNLRTTEVALAHKTGMMKAFDISEKAIRALKNEGVS